MPPTSCWPPRRSPGPRRPITWCLPRREEMETEQISHFGGVGSALWGASGLESELRIKNRMVRSCL